MLSALHHRAAKQGQYLCSHIQVKLCGIMLVTTHFKVHTVEGDIQWQVKSYLRIRKQALLVF